MVTLLLLLLLLLFVLSALLAAWTLWFQTYIYSEPVGQIGWRAPAAGGVLTLFISLWVLMDYAAPGRYRALHEFSARQDAEPYKELIVETIDGREETYRRERHGGHFDYLRNGKELPSRPRKITAVTEGGEKLTFLPEMDAKGNYKITQGEPLRYVNKDTGKVMTEGDWGLTGAFSWGQFILNVLLNLVHLALWCVCLWFLLQFQFWHAVGQAVIVWLALTIFVLPPLLEYAEQVAKRN